MSCRSASASAATGEVASLTSAIAVSPDAFAARCIATMSGLRPDWEMAIVTAPESFSGAW